MNTKFETMCILHENGKLRVDKNRIQAHRLQEKQQKGDNFGKWNVVIAHFLFSNIFIFGDVFLLIWVPNFIFEIAYIMYEHIPPS